MKNKGAWARTADAVELEGAPSLVGALRSLSHAMEYPFRGPYTPEVWVASASANIRGVRRQLEQQTNDYFPRYETTNPDPSLRLWCAVTAIGTAGERQNRYALRYLRLAEAYLREWWRENV
jgi:hypothetical protein